VIALLHFAFVVGIAEVMIAVLWVAMRFAVSSGDLLLPEWGLGFSASFSSLCLCAVLCNICVVQMHRHVSRTYPDLWRTFGFSGDSSNRHFNRKQALSSAARRFARFAFSQDRASLRDYRLNVLVRLASAFSLFGTISLQFVLLLWLKILPVTLP